MIVFFMSSLRLVSSQKTENAPMPLFGKSLS
jgi:hypothetical protein